MNQKRKSITSSNGQCAHRQGNGLNIRIIPIIPAAHLLNFLIFPALQLFQAHLYIKFWENFPTPPYLFQPPIIRYSREATHPQSWEGRTIELARTGTGPSNSYARFFSRAFFSRYLLPCFSWNEIMEILICLGITEVNGDMNILLPHQSSMPCVSKTRLIALHRTSPVQERKMSHMS